MALQTGSIHRLAALAAIVGVALLCGGCSWWHAHGRRDQLSMAYIAGPSYLVSNLYVRPLPQGRALPLTRGHDDIDDAAWSADGRVVVYSRYVRPSLSNEHGAYVDVYTKRRGSAARLIHRCPMACLAGDFAWSPGGRRIAFVIWGQVAVMNADGSGLRVVCAVAQCGQGLADPQWSPDGSRLVFSNQAVIGRIGVGIPLSRIWVTGSGLSDPHQLTQRSCSALQPLGATCAFDSAARWSPDGRWIAFSRLVTRRRPSGGYADHTQLDLVRPDGSQLHAVAVCAGILCNQLMPPTWAPDGRTIAYAPKAERWPYIDLVSLDGARTRIRTCSGGRCATPSDLAWSPDGSQIAFTGPGRNPSLFTIGSGGGGMRSVAANVRSGATWLAR